MNYNNGIYGSYLGSNGFYGPYQSIYQPNQFQSPQGQINSSQGQYVQQNTNDMPIQGVKFVTGDEAKGFMVLPNTRVMLMDRNNSIFYIKSANSLGESTLESFEFKKIDGTKPNTSDTAQKENIDLEQFVKKDQLGNLVTTDKLEGEIKTVKDELSKKIDELKKSINIKKYLEGEIKDV